MLRFRATRAPTNEKANVGPNATMAPSTCRNSSQGNSQARSIEPSLTFAADRMAPPSEDSPYDTRFERRPTKSTSTYSPSRSGVA